MKLKYPYTAIDDDGNEYTPTQAKATADKKFYLGVFGTPSKPVANCTPLEVRPRTGDIKTHHWYAVDSQFDYRSVNRGNGVYSEMGEWHYGMQQMVKDECNHSLEQAVTLFGKRYIVDSVSPEGVLYEFVDTHFDMAKVHDYFHARLNQVWWFKSKKSTGYNQTMYAATKLKQNIELLKEHGIGCNLPTIEVIVWSDL